jgi:hypothetical protein
MTIVLRQIIFWCTAGVGVSRIERQSGLIRGPFELGIVRHIQEERYVAGRGCYVITLATLSNLVNHHITAMPKAAAAYSSRLIPTQRAPWQPSGEWVK